MKSAVYNEVALVLLASKLIGRPVKWMSTRSEAFLSDAQARDNVTEAELALDKDGKFLGLRVKRRSPASAPICRPACQAFTGNLGTLAGVYRIAGDARRRRRRCSPTPIRCGPIAATAGPEAAYVIERMVDLAADELEHRSGRAAAAATTSRPRRCRSRPRSPSPTTAASSRRAWTWRSSSPTSRASRSARAESRKRGKLRGIGISNTIERAAAAGFEGAEIRFDRSGTRHAVLRQRHPGPGPRDHLQADRLRPARRRIPTRSTTSRATPTRCSSAKAPAARARPPSAARRSTWPREKIIDQGEGDRRAPAQGRCRRHEIRRRHLLQPEDQPAR